MKFYKIKKPKAPSLEIQSPANQRALWVFGGVSVLVVGVVIALMLLPGLFEIRAFSPFLLPKLNAALNSINTLLLLTALWAVKTRRIVLHKRLMLAALLLSALFLVSYLLYHAQGLEIRFGDLNGDGLLGSDEKRQAGFLRYLYYAILLSHILLSALVLPFVLFSFYLGLKGDIALHKRLVRFVWPVWFYVCLSGVLVYVLLSPYYPAP